MSNSTAPTTVLPAAGRLSNFPRISASEPPHARTLWAYPAVVATIRNMRFAVIGPAPGARARTARAMAADRRTSPSGTAVAR